MTKAIRFFLFALMVTTSSLPAALQFDLVPAIESGPVGTQVTFTGTLKNTSSTDNLFLNDIQFSFNSQAAAALAPNSNLFFANVPGILLPNESYSGPIFGVLIKSSIGQADYLGSVTVRGGADIFALSNLIAKDLQISSDIPVVAINANHLQLQFRRNTSATDVTYIVEGCSDLAAGSWSPVLTRTPAGGWVVNQPGASVAESGSGDLVLVTATDSVPLIDPNTSQRTPHRFLRVRIQ
jgi:hypothetical protein